jgi:hypothetical protein
MAKGGVVDMPNGGEYESGLTRSVCACCKGGLKAETGLDTTLVRELGRRTRAVLVLVA